jgi:hypothetical protein
MTRSGPSDIHLQNPQVAGPETRSVMMHKCGDTCSRPCLCTGSAQNERRCRTRMQAKTCSPQKTRTKRRLEDTVPVQNHHGPGSRRMQRVHGFAQHQVSSGRARLQGPYVTFREVCAHMPPIPLAAAHGIDSVQCEERNAAAIRLHGPPPRATRPPLRRWAPLLAHATHGHFWQKINLFEGAPFFLCSSLSTNLS